MISPLSQSTPLSTSELLTKAAAPKAAATQSSMPTDTVTLASKTHPAAAGAGDVDHDGDSR